MQTPEDSAWAFAAYEKVRARLPRPGFDNRPRLVETLDDLAGDFDTFLLDAFGVLNVGQSPIEGVPERIAGLQAMGKRVIVVTNAASYPQSVLLRRYAELGYHFGPEDVVSSRATLLQTLKDEPARHWGLMAPATYGREELGHLSFDFLGDDPAAYDRAEGFLFLGSGEWDEARQGRMRDALIRQPRPLLVGNPDIVAPREDGLSREPGHFAHRLADETGVTPRFFGKPFDNIYQIALSRLPKGTDPARVLMVGDTLHTDILGGRAAGVKTALVTGYGALLGLDIGACIESSGIRPDYILPRP